MLTEERRQIILQMLAGNGKVLVSHLVEALGVSEDTVRRDLRELDDAGLLQRVHGGALPVAATGRDYVARQSLELPAKSAIGRAAAALVRDGQVVVMDGGTTNLEVVRHLPATLRATVVTNRPPLATALAWHPHVDVMLVGGRLLKDSQVTVGADAVSALRQIRSDLCLLGICSIHPDAGVTADHMDEQPVKRAMVAGSARVVALAAGSKLGRISPFVVAPVSELSGLITDGTVPDEALAPYRAAGVAVIRAGEPGD